MQSERGWARLIRRRPILERGLIVAFTVILIVQLAGGFGGAASWGVRIEIGIGALATIVIVGSRIPNRSSR